MSESRAPGLTSMKIPKIEGLSSTASIYLDLTKIYFAVPDRKYDATLARVTTVYVEFGGLQSNLDALSNTKIRNATKDPIEKLKSHPSKSASAFYDTDISKLEKELYATNETLEKNIELLRQKIMESLGNVFINLTAVLRSKDPNSQELSNQLEQAEKTLQQLKAELNKEMKAREALDSQLISLGSRALSGIPASEEKKKVEEEFKNKIGPSL